MLVSIAPRSRRAPERGSVSAGYSPRFFLASASCTQVTGIRKSGVRRIPRRMLIQVSPM